MQARRTGKHSNLPPFDARPLTRSSWEVREGAEFSRFTARLAYPIIATFEHELAQMGVVEVTRARTLTRKSCFMVSVFAPREGSPLVKLRNSA